MSAKHPALILAVAFVCASAAPPATPLAGQPVVTELQGRTPGKTQRCVSAQPGLLFNTSDSDPHLILFDDGKTIWASRLDDQCGFGPGETIIPDQSASYYCRGDFVRVGRRIELSPFGQRCSLGNFTPYRMAK